jgi:DNA-binding response OmpR family regulator
VAGPSGRVLVVDDEESIRFVLQSLLEESGYTVATAASGVEARRQVGEYGPDVVLLDIVLPDANGLDLLCMIKEKDPDIEVLMMTSHASLETSLRAIRQGAYDYLLKPFEDLESVELILHRAMEKRRLIVNNRKLLDEQARRNDELSAVIARLSSMIGAGRAMASLRKLSDLLEFVIGRVALEMDVERATLLLPENDGGVLRVAASRGLSDAERDAAPIKLGEGVIGKVAQTRESQIFTFDESCGSGEAKAHSAWEPAIGRTFALAVPITWRDEVMGVITVSHRRSFVPFDEQDVSYLSGLAGQAAAAIESTRRHEQFGQANAALTEVKDQMERVAGSEPVAPAAAGTSRSVGESLTAVLSLTRTVQGRLGVQPLDVEALRSYMAAIRQIVEQKLRPIEPQAIPVESPAAPDRPVEKEPATKELAGAGIP